MLAGMLVEDLARILIRLLRALCPLVRLLEILTGFEDQSRREVPVNPNISVESRFEKLQISAICDGRHNHTLLN
jgi:hypothetical protein